jgi:XRE family transcriptional regulator of biofilm formation
MIGKRIKELRQSKGYSITELAKKAAISKSYLSQIERGLQTNPSLQFLNKLSVPLGTTIGYLLEEIKSKKHVEIELDEEWKQLIRQAIDHGSKKKRIFWNIGSS